jgi:hypothetical protein
MENWKLTHDVHTGQLGPDLSEQSDVCSVDVAGGEEIPVANLLALAFDFEPILDLLEFPSDQWAVRIALSKGEDEDLLTGIPPIL